MNELTRTTITSMEAAEWCGKEHAKLLRDIRKYVEQLGESKIGFTDFFKESTYVTDQNKTLRHGILEIKTTNILQSSQWEKWRDKIPDNYFCQVLHYLAVTEYDFAVLKAQIKSGQGERMRIETRHYFIERKEVEEDIVCLVESERKFWNCVVTGTRPDLILPAI